MPYQANYPATVAEVLNPSATFNPAALRAVKTLARSKPWRGSTNSRLKKIKRCNEALAAAYGLTPPAVCLGSFDCYIPAFNTIRLKPELSVVSFLHEFGHARGFDERQTCRWSINLFRRCFPRSYAHCRHVGHMLVSERSA